MKGKMRLMSKYSENKRAVALRYDEKEIAPIIIASGMGHMAEKIVEVASKNNVPIYEDTSLATILSQLELGQEVPEELYKMIVDIYVYFLNFTLSGEKKPLDIQTELQLDTEKS